MKSFTKIYSDYWTSNENREINNAGIDCQLIAFYLRSNSHSNALGAYYLPLLYISSDTGIPFKQVRIAVNKLCKINYCKYDFELQYIWVLDLALEQVGNVIGENDIRVGALRIIWKSLPQELGFIKEIYQQYHSKYYLEPRVFEKPVDRSLSNSNLFRFLSKILFWNKK